jgi:hypothetical protein
VHYGETVIDDVSLLLPVTAVIVTVPAFLPVTRPLDDTVATWPLLVCHVNAAAIVFPAASNALAVSCTVPLIAIVAEGGVTVTDATGPGVTVIEPEPDLPSLVAVIVVVPTNTPVARPDAETVAVAVLPDVHVTVRPVSTLPKASFNVAVNCCVEPLATFADAGATVTVATGASVTVTTDVPDCDSLVAVMVDVPGRTPVTTPFETVATRVLLELHVTGRLTTVPLTSFTTAVKVVVPSTTTVAVGGETTTLPTGATVTVTTELPDLVSLVAVTVADPGDTAVTTPPADTVATPVLFDDHVTTRSVTTVPDWSFTVAVSVVV